jgi:hypothetical protein
VEEERQSTKDELLTAIEEARMVLPGVQALFGFQLIAVFSDIFSSLSQGKRRLHLLATAFTASMATLMSALSVEFGLVSGVILHDALAALAMGGALFVALLMCWIVFPLRYRRRP